MHRSSSIDPKCDPRNMDEEVLRSAISSMIEKRRQQLDQIQSFWSYVSMNSRQELIFYWQILSCCYENISAFEDVFILGDNDINPHEVLVPIHSTTRIVDSQGRLFIFPWEIPATQFEKETLFSLPAGSCPSAIPAQSMMEPINLESLSQHLQTAPPRIQSGESSRQLDLDVNPTPRNFLNASLPRFQPLSAVISSKASQKRQRDKPKWALPDETYVFTNSQYDMTTTRKSKEEFLAGPSQIDESSGSSPLYVQSNSSKLTKAHTPKKNAKAEEKERKRLEREEREEKELAEKEKKRLEALEIKLQNEVKHQIAFIKKNARDAAFIDKWNNSSNYKKLKNYTRSRKWTPAERLARDLQNAIDRAANRPERVDELLNAIHEIIESLTRMSRLREYFLVTRPNYGTEAYIENEKFYFGTLYRFLHESQEISEEDMKRLRGIESETEDLCGKQGKSFEENGEEQLASFEKRRKYHLDEKTVVYGTSVATMLDTLGAQRNFFEFLIMAIVIQVDSNKKPTIEERNQEAKFLRELLRQLKKDTELFKGRVR